MLRQPVVHNGVQALQEGRRLDHRLVVGVVEALDRRDGGSGSHKAKEDDARQQTSSRWRWRQRHLGWHQPTRSPAVIAARSSESLRKVSPRHFRAKKRGERDLIKNIFCQSVFQSESQPTVMSQRDSLAAVPGKRTEHNRS